MHLPTPSLILLAATAFGPFQFNRHASLVVLAQQEKKLEGDYPFSESFCLAKGSIDGGENMTDLDFCEKCVFTGESFECEEGAVRMTCEDLNGEGSEICRDMKLMTGMGSRRRALLANERQERRKLQGDPEICFLDAIQILQAAGNCNDLVEAALLNGFTATFQFTLLATQCATCVCDPVITSDSNEFVDPDTGILFCQYELDGECDGVCGGGDSNTGGDPHFHTMHDEYFGYHGICDLVLAKSENFGSGKGLDLHIRTEEQEGYSSISNAALKIGNDVFEVAKDGSYYLNGERNVDLPTDISGYEINMDKGKNTDVFFADVSHGFTAAELRESAVFTIDVGEGDNIEIQVWNGYLWVNARMNHLVLQDSTGLLGTWGKLGKIGRDGSTVIEDADEFGQEWQVLENEPNLFQVVRAPQHPEPCTPTTSVGRRRLGGAKLAKDACAHVEGPKKQFCLFDVSVTGDATMASAPYYHA